MRQTTIEKRARPIIQWAHDYWKQRRLDPGTNAVWVRCAVACSRDAYARRHTNTRSLYDYVLSQL